MLYPIYLFCCILIHLTITAPQINLYYTDWMDKTGDDHKDLQHNCLRVPDSGAESGAIALSIYCMNEPLSKFIIGNNTALPYFTFATLAKRNITSEQLYRWSAPIDIAERYQLYLDQLFNDLAMSGTEVFYNCTLPKFGPQCQYELEYHDSSYSSLFVMIRMFYRTYQYHPTTLTCYMHLQCDRGPRPSCLDWTEICDGQVDCLDGNVDEEQCWELELNQCKEDEYRCANGQCIPQSFYGDLEKGYHDCVDGSDELDTRVLVVDRCADQNIAILFRCEDMLCERQALTSSCTTDRRHLLLQAMFSAREKSIPDQCWSAFKCVMSIYKMNDPICDDVCTGRMCVEIIERTCPNTMFIPAVPFLFGQIYLAYRKNASDMFFSNGELRYLYMCSNNSYYNNYYPADSLTLINGTACYRRFGVPRFSKPIHAVQDLWLLQVHHDLWRYYLSFSSNSTFCNASNTYQCANSVKCISKHRRNNKINDCPYGDDEEKIDVDPMLSTDQFPIFSSYHHEQYGRLVRYIRLNISFLTICNGYTELLPIRIGEQNETDETHCEQWECNNIYTRCNDFWNCLNGADELGCDLPFKVHCSPDEHLCVSPITNRFMCLPVEKANDGNADRLGGTDEPRLCRRQYEFIYPDNFYCRNSSPAKCINAEKLCDSHKDCEYGDDEQFCKPEWTYFGETDFCYYIDDSIRPDPINLLCRTVRGRGSLPLIPHFSLVEPAKPYPNSMTNPDRRALADSSVTIIPRCHRGLDLRVWPNANNDSITRTCLCPPNFYGETCQYQNQRVSLALRFRVLSGSWQTPFAIIVSLIDDSEQRVIHSTEQFTYVSCRDCQKKFNLYLLYSSRPKNESHNYSIHIYIYEKISLAYRGSVRYLIPFPFLPFHRLAYLIDILGSTEQTERCFGRPCVQGRCRRYLNAQNEAVFCQCKPGWSGRDCTIPYTHTCSPNSLCLGISANNRRPICVCSPNHFGPRCLLKTACHKDYQSACKHGGQCVPADEYTVSAWPFTCVCLEGFTGDRCEHEQNKLILSFDSNIVVSQTIFIHFINIVENIVPSRATTFAINPLRQDSLIFHWSQPFHIVFLEPAMNRYYLVLVQESYSDTSIFKERISPQNYCPHVKEVFNLTFAQLHPLRRIKYYHLACQKQPLNLSCFYDQDYLCLCTNYSGKSHANCFEFTHNTTFDCLGRGECQNSGSCFQDDPQCPTRSMCSCPSCFYGRLCQFSTSGFGLSLDAILGYHIQPQRSIFQQSLIVKVSITIAMIIIILGFLNGILALLTFKSQVVLHVGCGFYLIFSSITVLLTMMIFGLKFWILVLSQMAVILDKSFLAAQCKSVDFLLRVCLNMDQWLSACVAIERAVTVVKGVGFNKKRSRQVAPFVIGIILIINIVSSIYDSIYRRLIQEESDNNTEKRIWCIVTSSQRLQMLNSAIYICHFFGPFTINFISTIIILTEKTRRQTNLRTNRALKILLREQFLEHKHLFAAPVLLVVLALPRLVIFFVTKCMKSADDSWVFLLGYFISFIPSMLTFVIFVLPSTLYRKEYRKSVTQLRMNVQRRLRIIE